MLFSKNDWSGPTQMPYFPIVLMAWTPVKMLIYRFHFDTLLSVSTNIYSHIPFLRNYSAASMFLIHDGSSYTTLTHLLRLTLQKLLLLCPQQKSFANALTYSHLKICWCYQGERPRGSSWSVPAFQCVCACVCCAHECMRGGIVPSKSKFYNDFITCYLTFKKKVLKYDRFKIKSSLKT